MIRLRGLLARLLAAATGTSLLVVFLVVFASSVSRYAFNAPFVWSEELAKYAMIYGTLFGAALAYLQGAHIRFAILADSLPAGPRQVLARLVDVAVLGLGATLLVSGFLFAARRGALLSSGLPMPMAYAQAAIAIGGFLFAVIALLNLFFPARRDA
jgi:TRAP-type C4-dicarboxylate transport system permease small subunit